MPRGRHTSQRAPLSLPRALMIAACGYLVLGVAGYLAWAIQGGAPSGGEDTLWSYAALLPLVFLEGVIAWRFADRPLLRFVFAQVGVLALCVVLAYVGVMTGAVVGWFVLWTFLEPRAIPFLAFWWPAAWVARIRLRRLWSALA